MSSLAKRVWAARPANFYRDVWLFAITILVFISANASFNQASAIQHQASAIQHSRERAIREACEQQNERNGTAFKFLQGLPVSRNQPAMSPERRHLLIQQFTDALVGPVQDCEKRVQQVTR
jgi:hypothetical protein